MPSTATITAFYSFTTKTVIKSAEHNTNFGVFRGHIIAVDPNTATAAATLNYDLGSTDYRWRTVYGGLIDANTVSASSIVGTTITATRLVAGSATITSLVATSINATTIVGTSISATSIVGTTITATSFVATTATISSLVATTGTVTSLLATTLTVSGTAVLPRAPVIACAVGNPASATAGNPIIVPTERVDTNSAYDNSTGRFTVPTGEGGSYRLSITTTGVPSTALSVYWYKGAVIQDVMFSISTNDLGNSGTIVVTLVAGDVVDFRPNVTYDTDYAIVIFERIGGYG